MYIYIYIYIYILVDMADITPKIDFGHYMALGMVWYGAKYSRGVWERFAHTFNKSDFLLKSVFWVYYICLTSFLETSLSCMFLTKCLGRNDRIDRGIISRFRRNKTDFLGETLIKTESWWISHFSSCFIIDLFHHV